MEDTQTTAANPIGILSSRKSIIGLLLLSLVFSALSWRHVVKNRSVAHHHVDFFGLHPSHDPVTVFGLGFCIFFLLSIAFRSPLRVDRFVFGIASISVSLSLVVEFMQWGPQVFALRVADALCWILVTAICAATLAGWKAKT